MCILDPITRQLIRREISSQRNELELLKSYISREISKNHFKEDDISKGKYLAYKDVLERLNRIHL